MAGTIGGFGVIFKIDITSTLTAVTYLLEGEMPKQKKFVAVATLQNATGG